MVAPTQASRRKPVGLALQGGGSWGAYTWGALDALLASRSVAIAQLSGTSAGAINAAIVASALVTGGTAAARATLRAFWTAIADPAADLVASIWRPVDRGVRESIGAWFMTAGLSPYDANPLGVNPLRAAIAAHVDVDALRSPRAPALYVTVTNVRSGLPRVISNDEMSIDALVASACLPQLFHAVEIDGEMYWDGGYSGNPTLWPIIHDGSANDVIVVQLSPDTADEIPRDAAGIRRRVGEIVFNSSLVAEMQAIAAMRAIAARADGPVSVSSLRLHRIGPPRRSLFERGSGLERSRAWLELLFDEGRQSARGFLARHGGDLGVRETLDIAHVFTDAHKPKLRVAANDDFADDGGAAAAALSAAADSRRAPS
ncbi:MAG: patatin-like phospholipase family protein [Proteobacteria bacterium]|jgi:NTE family protein|nr:patatin-like phospholipase family protein [Pseudomonadota bacterium]